MSNINLVTLPRDMGIYYTSFLSASERAIANGSCRNQALLALSVDRALAREQSAVRTLSLFQNIEGKNPREQDRSFEKAAKNLSNKRKNHFEPEPMDKKFRIDEAGSETNFHAQAEWKDRCIGLCALLHDVSLFNDQWDQIRANTTNCYTVAQAIIKWIEENREVFTTITFLSAGDFRWEHLPTVGSHVPQPNLGPRVKILTSIPRQIKYFSNLQNLDLRFNFLTVLPSEIKGLPIQTLNLSGNPRFKDIPLFLAEMPELKEVILKHTAVSFTAFAQFIESCCKMGRTSSMRFTLDFHIVDGKAFAEFAEQLQKQFSAVQLIKTEHPFHIKITFDPEQIAATQPLQESLA